MSAAHTWLLMAVLIGIVVDLTLLAAVIDINRRRGVQTFGPLRCRGRSDALHVHRAPSPGACPDTYPIIHMKINRGAW